MIPKQIIDNKKNCTKCNNWLDVSLYNKGKSKDSFRSQCRNCERDYKIMLRYNLTREQVADFWTRENCEICERPFINSSLGKGRFKCVDHCHNTGKSRGFLCNACNAGIGYLGDDISRMNKAIHYLSGNGSLEKELENENRLLP